MWIQYPVLADLSPQTKRLAVGWQQELDGGGVESDTVIQRMNLVEFVDATDDHHPHQNLKIVDMPWIACKQGFYRKRSISFHYDIHARRGDIHARKCFDYLIRLNDHNGIVESCGFYDHGRLLRVRPRVWVPGTTCLFRTNQHDVRNQVYK